jgi:predicted metalloprotease with PDZ domain
MIGQQILTLSLNDTSAHIISAQLQIKNPVAQPLVLALPRWIPGSYLLRDFAKHLFALSVADEQGHALTIERLDLSRWQIDAPIGTINVRYQLYAYDASVRGNYFCADYAFINPAATALMVEAWREAPYHLQLAESDFIQSASIYTTLPMIDKVPASYMASDYDALIEHPLLIGKSNVLVLDWMVYDMPHRMVLVDEVPLPMIDRQQLIDDLTLICQQQHDFWQGDRPYHQYLFQVMVSADGYGGLEHLNSTALMTSRASLPLFASDKQDKAYLDFLALCSHEYFHAWMVKRIKPSNLIRPNLHTAEITSLLWIFEGFTSLYDDWFLQRAGHIDEPALLARWSDTLTRTLIHPGGDIQSVADASREAWIKFYQPNENSSNSSVSYYTRGAALALALWATLTEHGKHLDDLLHNWWQRWLMDGEGLTEQRLIADLQTLTSAVDWHAWLNTHVYAPDGQLLAHLAACLPILGIQLSTETRLQLGISWEEQPSGLWIKSVCTQGPAHYAGVCVGDELIAIDGWRIQRQIDINRLLDHWQRQSPATPMLFTVNHKGRLKQHRLMPMEQVTSVKLTGSSNQKI